MISEVRTTMSSHRLTFNTFYDKNNFKIQNNV